jgi:ribosomal protein S18 acetylase RimI-like enzyme
MKIRKAIKKDFEEYCRVKVEGTREYALIIKKHINIPNKLELKKEFFEFINKKDKRGYLFFEDKKLVGYILVSTQDNAWSKFGYIQDIFVKKEFRKKRIATQLILEFLSYAKFKKINQIFLSVNIENNIAIKLYKKLGFKINKYDMQLRLK